MAVTALLARASSCAPAALVSHTRDSSVQRQHRAGYRVTPGLPGGDGPSRRPSARGALPKRRPDALVCATCIRHGHAAFGRRSCHPVLSPCGHPGRGEVELALFRLCSPLPGSTGQSIPSAGYGSPGQAGGWQRVREPRANGCRFWEVGGIKPRALLGTRPTDHDICSSETQSHGDPEDPPPARRRHRP